MQARSSQALLLGEIHTSAADHGWQLETLQALHRQRLRLILGLEMVPAARQGVLDRFSAGSLSEEAFLQQVGWAEVWGHDPELYLPLLRWARAQAIPLLALNVEPAVMQRVRSQGLLAVPVAEREGLAAPVAAGAAYRQRLQQAWLGHRALLPSPPAAVSSPDGPPRPVQPASSRQPLLGTGHRLSPADADDLERFIASQLLRDRAMAERIALAQRQDPSRLVVALIGRGHLQNGEGVPDQLRDLGLQRVLVGERPELPAGCAPAPAGARLGAYLESRDGAVWVRQVAPGSAAARGDLRPGDRILAVEGAVVQRAGEVIQRVRAHPEAMPLRLTLARAGRTLQLELLLPPPPPRR